ncbi:MAG: helix-turn-helix domain-containing protein [Treponema sp.]|jgi:hypothetical protein|nr:helix-turn-helix domain-containing protein [Treponema sp.]
MVKSTKVQKKRYTHLSPAEREEIAIALEQGRSIRSIAESLDRSPSSVSREITRNSPPENQVKTGETGPSGGRKTGPAEATPGNAWPNPMWNTIWFMTAGPARHHRQAPPRFPRTCLNYESIYRWMYTERRDLIKYLVRGHKSDINGLPATPPRLLTYPTVST